MSEQGYIKKRVKWNDMFNAMLEGRFRSKHRGRQKDKRKQN